MKQILSFQNESQLTPSMAYILGVLCGDGCLSKLTKFPHYMQIELCTTEKSFADYFANQFTESFGIEPKRYNYTRHIDSPLVRGFFSLYIARCNSQEICKKINQLSNSFKTKEWTVPTIVSNSSDSIKGMFLRGIFDSEADVTFDAMKDTGITYCYPRIRFSSTNKEGTLQVKHLLESIGIGSYLVSENIKIKKYKVISYRLILKKMLRCKLFQDKVGFGITRKRNLLSKFIQNGGRQ